MNSNREPETNRHRDHELLAFFVGAVVSAALVVPFAIFGHAVDFTLTAVALLSALATAGAMIVAVYLLRRRIAAFFSMPPPGPLGEVYGSLSKSIVHFREGKIEDGAQHLDLAFRAFLSWNAWVTTRRWMLGVLVALVGTFATLLGGLLLSRQNALIDDQNQYFRQQIADQREHFQQQMDLQQRQFSKQQATQDEQQYQARRAQLIALLYDRQESCTREARQYPWWKSVNAGIPCVDRQLVCPLKASVRTRQEAALALIEIESAHGKRADLTRADLRGTDFENSNMSNADLQSADLGGANLLAADLSSANLTHANLAGAALHRAVLMGATLEDTDLSGVFIDQINLSSADLSWAKLEGAQLNGARLQGAKLRGANLKVSVCSTPT